IVEHVRETSIRPEHPGIGGSNLRYKVEHEVTLRGSHPRESHSSERAHVLSSDGPTPESLDAVHHIHSVNKESSFESMRWVNPRRSGSKTDEEATQQRDHDDGKPSGDERVESQTPDNFE